VRKSKINILCQQCAIVVFTRFRIELRHDDDWDEATWRLRADWKNFLWFASMPLHDAYAYQLCSQPKNGVKMTKLCGWEPL